MSEDWLIKPERSDHVPRVARATGDRYDRGAPYCGTQRAPQRPDEEGAVCVIDLLFGGRIVLYPLDPNFLRVRHVYAHQEPR